MSTYRKEWECCESVTETESWEPSTCPFCSNNKQDAEIVALREALKEAIDLRVSLFRNSDIEGDTDKLPDSEVVKMDSYAKKWFLLTGESE